MRHAASLSILAAVVLWAGLSAAAELPTWKMAEMKDLDPAAWGPPAEDAGHACRSAKADTSAGITVPIWWGKTRRPPEGTVYVLKLTYKDTATKPVVFSSHAGAGSYWGPSEVHRFGGSGDGQWKTAHLPLSWDLVMRKNAPGDVTELFLRSNRELPVESIVVAPPDDGAAERYFHETRQWIARAQAEKRKNARPGRKQTPDLPDAWKAKPLVAFVRTYMSPLLPSAAPQKGEAGSPLKLRMARNEYETAAFGVYANGADLRGVNFSVSDLEGPAGKLTCKVDCRAAEYAVVSGGRLFPQRMWPAYAVDVPEGQSHLFWVTVKTLGLASRPGKYGGTVNITAAGADAALPVEVEVVDVMLPTMQQAGLELGACGFPTLGELKTLAEYNHTGMDIWFGGSQPQMKVTDGKLVLDWYYLDDWMEYAAKKLSMTHMFWFMGGDPYGFPDTLNLERDLYRALAGDVHVGRRTFLKKTNAEPEKVLPELRPLYLDFIRQLAVHAKAAGWPKRLIIHPFDEPAKWVQSSKWDNPYHPVIGTGEWIKPHFKDCCALIRQGAKGHNNIFTGGDIHHVNRSGRNEGPVFLPDIDVFCTNAVHEDEGIGAKVKASGTEFWQYSGCNDQAPAHQGRFTFGWYFGAYWAASTPAPAASGATAGPPPSAPWRPRS